MASVAFVEIAMPVVSQSLGIAPEQARARLAGGPGTLATGLSRPRARRLATLLRVLGNPVRVSRGSVALPACCPSFDMALQVADVFLRPALAARLAPHLGLPASAVATELGRPGGIVRHGLCWTDVTAWRRRARGINGLQVLVSDPSTARYDLMPWDRPTNLQNLGALLRFLRRLGLSTCPLTGAVAADVDQTTASLVMRRFPDCGLFALNRDFQRFDLVLDDIPAPVQHELASFLSARTALPRQAFARPERLAGLRIEGALSRSDALAFQADYAAIGLETRLRLVLEKGSGAA